MKHYTLKIATDFDSDLEALQAASELAAQYETGEVTIVVDGAELVVNDEGDFWHKRQKTTPAKKKSKRK